MKVSIVTISFNQVQFLEKTILSVIHQDYDNIEYIVVDAGSSDGSRELIRDYSTSISKAIFEADRGQPDGLNKGFNAASGDIFAFVNSDDILLPGAVRKAVEFLRVYDHCDALYGHGYHIDKDDQVIRKIYSDRFDLKRFVYGTVTFMQPSLFFRKKAFLDVGGFNIDNKTCWDGELLIDFGLYRKNIERINHFMASFRLHSNSISGSSSNQRAYAADRKRLFWKVMRRNHTAMDTLILIYLKILKILKNPRNVPERMTPYLFRRQG